MILYGLMGALVLLLLILVICLSLLISYAIKDLRHQKTTTPSRRPISAHALNIPPRSKGIPVRPENSQPQPLNGQEQPLLNKLLTILGGDKDTAKRLLAAVKKRHPDRDYAWHLDKVICDIERDRRH
jgi:hypothetical protein